MKSIGLGLALIFLTGALSLAASAEEYDFDLSKMSLEELVDFESDVDSAIKEYHKPTSKEESAILDAVKEEVEDYFSEGKVSWPWFDYSYTKEWDFYTVTTHMDYKKEGDDSSERYDIYGELYYDDGYVIYFLEAGHDRIIDLQDSISQGQWMKLPDPFINSTTGLDLALLGEDDLNNLMDEIVNEIDDNHTTNSSTRNVVLSLVKDQVEKKYTEPSWPWINYTYTNDWGFYTLTTSVNYKDANDEKQKASVYAEAYPTDGDYELYYLTVGDDVLIDKRAELPADLSDPDASVTLEGSMELTETQNTLESETEEAETEEAETEAAETEEPETETAGTEEAETEAAETEEAETETVETEEPETETETKSEIQTEEDRTVYAPDIDLTGMIIEATMNTITVQTEDGSSYICATEDTEFDLASGGIMLGMEVEVVLDSTTSNEYGLFAAESVKEIKETEEETEEESETEPEEAPTENIEESEPETQTEQVTETLDVPEEEDPVLYQNGSRGDEVKAAQEKLIALGYLSGTADGIYGNMTEEAVRKFQEDNGIEASGAITEKTMEALDIKNTSEGEASFDLAFIKPGPAESTYFMFDTNSKKAIYFDSIDGLVMETYYTGELSDGVAMDWSAYGEEGEEWIEYFTYTDGSSTGTFKGIDGYVGDYDVLDLDAAMEVLNTKPGYGSESSSQTEAAAETAEEDEKETQAKETKAATEKTEDEYAEGIYEGRAITAMKNMAKELYPYGVKFHSLAAESTTRYVGNGVWYVKQKVDITNVFGTKRTTCLECNVDFKNNIVTDFKETK